MLSKLNASLRMQHSTVGI